MSWDDEGPAARFWKRLVRERAIEFMRCPDYLKGLRYNNKRAVADQKTFGHIWEEYGTNVYKLIAGAHGESWDKWDEEDEQKEMQRVDEEDEQKEMQRVATAPNKTPPLNQRQNNDNLVAACETSTRGGEHLLQGEPEESEQELEKGRKEEEGKGACRRGGFYRAAGGT